MNIKILLVVIAIFSGASLARSQGTLSWQFDSTDYVVQPTDQILLTGTISNSSDTPFFIQGAGASFTGDLQFHYQVSWQLALFGQTVPADGTLQFDFCTLLPIGGSVDPGVYVADPISNPAWLTLVGTDTTESEIPSQNFFQITVVPEPSTTSLGVVALIFISILRFWKRRVLDVRPCCLTSRWSQPPLALAVPLSRFTPRVGGGSAFFVRQQADAHLKL
jgi:hypothetical protein